MRTASNKAKNRSGIQTLELLLVVPILAVLVIAALGYGRAMALRSAANYAAIATVREAGKEPGPAQAANAGCRVSAAFGITVSETPDPRRIP